MTPGGKKIYLMGAYTGDSPEIVLENVNRAMDAWLRLTKEGHFVYCPHLTHFLHMRALTQGVHMPYRFWMNYDRVLLMQCDVGVRLRGPSSGADDEEELMRLLSKPVYHGEDEFLAAYPPK